MAQTKMTPITVLLVALFIVHVVPSGQASPPIINMADDESAAQAIIKEYEDKLRVDCGPLGEFQYCAKNALCFQHPGGMWDMQRRSDYVCDPRNKSHYGCQCRWAALEDGSCSLISCFSRMRKYFSSFQDDENETS